MRIRRIERAWEGDVRIGAFVASFPDGRVQLTDTMLQAPEWLRYPVIHPTEARCAGYLHASDRIVEWTGQQWEDRGPGCGMRACAYLLTGELVTNPDCRLPWGPLGMRYVDETGRVVPAAETYADDDRRIYEYVTRGDVTIGQGGKGRHGEDPCLVLADGKRRLLARGTCRQIRFARDAGFLAVGYFDQASPDPAFVVITLTRGEVTALPLADDVPAPPPPKEDPPVSEDRLLQLLHEERATFGEKLDADQSLALLNAAAWRYNAEVGRTRYGLLKKTSGNFGILGEITASVDWLIRDDGMAGDFLEDAGNRPDNVKGIAHPQRPSLIPEDLGRFIAPVRPADVPAPPSTPPTGPELPSDVLTMLRDIHARVANIERIVQAPIVLGRQL